MYAQGWELQFLESFLTKKLLVLSCYNYQEMIMNGSVKVFKM